MQIKTSGLFPIEGAGMRQILDTNSTIIKTCLPDGQPGILSPHANPSLQMCVFGQDSHFHDIQGPQFHQMQRLD